AAPRRGGLAGGLSADALGGRSRDDHDGDRRARRGRGGREWVLLRRALPPAVPCQEPRRLLRPRRHGRRLPGRAQRPRASDRRRLTAASRLVRGAERWCAPRASPCPRGEDVSCYFALISTGAALLPLYSLMFSDDAPDPLASGPEVNDVINVSFGLPWNASRFCFPAFVAT